MKFSKNSLLAFHVLRLLTIELILVFFVLLFLGKGLDIPLSVNPDKYNPSILYYDDGKTEIARFDCSNNFKETNNEALYFKEHIRRELNALFSEIDEKGNLKIAKPNGRKWNIYEDGLKIYSSLDKDLQIHAETALKKHLSFLQPTFLKQLSGCRNFPYSNDFGKQMSKRLFWNATKNSPRYQTLKAGGYSTNEILKTFKSSAPMSVFSWNGEIDTLMTPRDSIRYYKSFLHAGMVSIEPQTGFIKTWVGGAHKKHFGYDHVGQVKRQAGSIIKPFVYATALAMGVVDPCEKFSGRYCVGNWCPGGNVAGTFEDGLIFQSGSTPVPVMSKMGPKAGPINLAKFLADLDIHLPKSLITPPMSMGTMDVSLLEIVGGYSALVNEGVFTSPMSIYRIEDKMGNIIYEANPKAKEVLHPNVAYAILSILERGVQIGTSRRLTRDVPYGNIIYPTAGKTGNTQGNSDAWFVGMTPDLVTGVWVGGEERSIRFGWSGLGQAASAALPMYGYFMNAVYADTSIQLSKEAFKVPLGFDKAWPNCQEGNPFAPKKDSVQNGESYYYTEPQRSDSKNPFL